MLKEQASFICKQINSDSFNSFTPTSVVASVRRSTYYYEVVVVPSVSNEHPRIFYHLDAIGVIVSAFKLHSFVKFLDNSFEVVIF